MEQFNIKISFTKILSPFPLPIYFFPFYAKDT